MTAKILKHKFQSAIADGGDATMVRPAHDWNDEHDFWLGSRTVTGTTDTLAHADHLSLITYNNAGGVAVSLPAPAGANMPNGWRCLIRNVGIGNVTITGTGGATINGSAQILATGNVLELFSLGVADYVGLIPITRYGNNVIGGQHDFQGVTNIKGTQTNDAAAAGYLGEYIESVRLSPGTYYPGTNQYVDVIPGGLTIPAGDWLLRGVVNCQFTSVTDNPYVFTYLSTTSSAQGSFTNNALYSPRGVYPGTTTINTGLHSGPLRVSVSSPQTWYLVVWAQFTGGGAQLMQYWGTLSARRIR